MSTLPMDAQLNGFVDKYFESLSTVVASPPLPTAHAHSQADTSNTSNSLATTSTPHHQQELQSRSSPLVLVEAFISSLTNRDENGRVSVVLTGELHSSSLRFFLLNPAVHFAEVVQECRAVIVAGGTMQPVSTACSGMCVCVCGCGGGCVGVSAWVGVFMRGWVHVCTYAHVFCV